MNTNQVFAMPMPRLRYTDQPCALCGCTLLQIRVSKAVFSKRPFVRFEFIAKVGEIRVPGATAFTIVQGNSTHWGVLKSFSIKDMLMSFLEATKNTAQWMSAHTSSEQMQSTLSTTTHTQSSDTVSSHVFLFALNFDLVLPVSIGSRGSFTYRCLLVSAVEADTAIGTNAWTNILYLFLFFYLVKDVAAVMSSLLALQCIPRTNLVTAEIY